MAGGNGSAGMAGGNGDGGGLDGGRIGVCSAPPWNPTLVYMAGQIVSYNGKEYIAQIYTMGDDPEHNHEATPDSRTGKPWSFPTDC
jgi:hypothetical protein